MPKAIITIGISASGKSHFAKEQKGFNIICRDDIRMKLLEEKHGRKIHGWELWKLWKFKDEDQVTAQVDILLDIAQKEKLNIIIADTNLNKNRREKLKTRLESMGWEVEYKMFEISFEEAVKRDKYRAETVGVEVLWNQYKQWFAEFGLYPKYVPNPELQKAILVDVDGTIAEMRGRGPFEWDKVGTDKPITPVINIVKAYKCLGNYKIIILSGRDGSCKDLTIKWLKDNFVPFDEIYLRTAGDMRDDATVKSELFYTHVANKYNVEMIFDDRPKVCRQWRLLGVPVSQVADPLIEF